MGSAFHQLCPRYSGTLTPTAPTAIRLWDTFTLPPLETKEFTEQIISFQSCGARLAQWVKHWPVGLAVPSSSPARGGNFTTVNGDLLHTACRYQFFCPDMTEILDFEKDVKSQVIHPSFLSWHLLKTRQNSRVASPASIPIYRNSVY